MFKGATRREFAKGAASVSALGVVGGCLGGESDTRSWTMATAVGDGHPFEIGAQKFKEELENLSDGRFELTVESGGAYGSELEQLETLSSGGVEMASQSFGTPLIAYLPIGVFGTLSTPFWYEKPYWDHILNIWSVLNEDDELVQTLAEEQSLQTIGEPIFSGVRNIAGQKAFEAPEETTDVPIRIPEVPNWDVYFSEIGFDPRTMPITELYSALETGTIEGSEGEPAQLISQQTHEVQSHYTLTEHYVNGFWFLLNQDLYEGLTDEERDTFEEAATNARETSEEKNRELMTDALVELEDDYGMNIVEADRNAYREAVQPAIEAAFEEMEPPLSLDEIADLAP